MKIETTKLPGVLLLTPAIHNDSRGFFMETHRTNQIAEATGEPVVFVQGSESQSVPWVVRGLHYQIQNPQGTLLHVLRGEAWVCALDIRRSSPNFGKHALVRLDSQSRQQIYIPPGFASGFLATAQGAQIGFQYTAFYDRAVARSIRWSDPNLGINWPLAPGLTPTVSARDISAPLFSDAELLA